MAAAAPPGRSFAERRRRATPTARKEERSLDDARNSEVGRPTRWVPRAPKSGHSRGDASPLALRLERRRFLCRPPDCRGGKRLVRVGSVYRYGREGWIEDTGVSGFESEDEDDEESAQKYSKYRQSERDFENVGDGSAGKEYSSSQGRFTNYDEEDGRGYGVPDREKESSEETPNHSENVWTLIFGPGGFLFLLETLFKWFRSVSQISSNFIRDSLPSSIPSTIVDTMVNASFILISIWIMKSLLDVICTFGLLISASISALWLLSAFVTYFRNYPNFDRRQGMDEGSSFYRNSQSRYYDSIRREEGYSNRKRPSYYRNEDFEDKEIQKKEGKPLSSIFNDIFDRAFESFLKDDSIFSSRSKRNRFYDPTDKSQYSTFAPTNNKSKNKNKSGSYSDERDVIFNKTKSPKKSMYEKDSDFDFYGIESKKPFRGNNRQNGSPKRESNKLIDSLGWGTFKDPKRLSWGD